MLKQDFVPPIFAPGPDVAGPAFKPWLDAQQGEVKLPFTVWREPKRAGAIGWHEAVPKETWRFGDLALGIPLDERLRQLCGAAPACRVWLSGRFGTPFGMPDEKPGEVFQVAAVHGAVEKQPSLAAWSTRGPECLGVRAQKPLHCARGSGSCEKCKEAASKPSVPQLLDLCPYGDAARPTVEVVREGKKTWRAYDVLRTFKDADEARAFATKHRITDVSL